MTPERDQERSRTDTTPGGPIAQDSRNEWELDPVGFARHVLSATPWEKQIEILEAVRDNSRVAVRSCNGSGKTFIAAHAV